MSQASLLNLCLLQSVLVLLRSLEQSRTSAAACVCV
jgi:hypothetical protein